MGCAVPTFGGLAGGLSCLVAVLWVLPGVLWPWLWLSLFWGPCSPAPQQQRCVSSPAAAASIAAGNAALL